MKRFLLFMRYLSFAVLTTSILSSCGGGGGGGSGSSSSNSSGNAGGGSSSTVASGRFIDSAVGGLSYVSGDQSGVTDASGAFTYEVGKPVTFSVGAIVLGQAIGKGVISPVDLVSGGTPANSTVDNIASFLQTIDNDGDPSNGIWVTPEVSHLASGRTINFTQSKIDFKNDGNVQSLVSEMTSATTAGARLLVPSSTAEANLSGSLIRMYTGPYKGTFSGADTGTWQVSIESDGSVVGTGTSATKGGYLIAGSVNSDGTLTFHNSNVSGSLAFTGMVASDFSVTGTWTNTAAGMTGSFSGQKVNASTGKSNTLVVTGGNGGVAGTYPVDNNIPSPSQSVGGNMIIVVGGGGGVPNYWLITVTVPNLGGYGASSVEMIPHTAGSTMYECDDNVFGLGMVLGDCSGLYTDAATRTLTFNNVELIGPNYGDVIFVNGTVGY